MHQESGRRAVHQRVADDLLASEDLHELLVEQALERGGRILAADRLDLG